MSYFIPFAPLPLPAQPRPDSEARGTLFPSLSFAPLPLPAQPHLGSEARGVLFHNLPFTPLSLQAQPHPGSEARGTLFRDLQECPFHSRRSRSPALSLPVLHAPSRHFPSCTPVSASLPVSFFPLLSSHHLSLLSISLPLFGTLYLHSYIRPHLQGDPHPFLFGSPARYVHLFSVLLHNKLNNFGSPASTVVPLRCQPDRSCPYSRKGSLYRADLRTLVHTIGRFGLPLDSSASAYAFSESPLSPLGSDYHSVHMSPSNMIEDSPAHIDHILTIEATVNDIKSKNDATHQLLQNLLDRLGPLQAQNVPNSV